jgi:hypothetical protein
MNVLLLGYVGPGAGLGFLGSLLAVVAVVAVGLLGLVLYPLKLAVAWYRKRSAAETVEEFPSRQLPSCQARAGSMQ